MAIPWIKVAGTIYQLGKAMLAGKELSDQAHALLKERKRSLDNEEQTAARVQQLEEALAKQLESHRQHQTQMELMRSALEDLQKSLRLALTLAALATASGFAAILLAVFK